MSYQVIVADNSHYMDESEQWFAGSFDTYEEAVAMAKQIVDKSLDEAFKVVDSANKLYEHYVRWGDDPFVKVIDGRQDGGTFSAWDYAKERCSAMAKNPSMFRITPLPTP